MMLSRSLTREVAMQHVFAMAFGGQSLEETLCLCDDPDYYARLSTEDEAFVGVPDESESAYLRRVLTGVSEHGPELDEYIEKYAVGWKLQRISRVATALLRVAMFEVLYMDDIPNRVAFNEAVEIAKKYEPREVVSFVNGILGSFARGELLDEDWTPEKSPEDASEDPITAVADDLVEGTPEESVVNDSSEL